MRKELVGSAIGVCCAVVIALTGQMPQAASEEHARGEEIQIALTCFKSGEETDGLNKICYYNCAGSRAAITVKSYQICPLTINR